MPKFDFSARDAAGVASKGAIEAETLELATETLKDRGLFVMSIDEHKERAAFEKDLPFFNKIPIKDLVIFSRQFAVLMGAKVPMVQALKTMIKQTHNERFRRIVADVAAEVENGTPLSAALALHPNAFSDFFVNMIRSGETTGRLEEVMNYLADQMERDFDLMTKIKGAMIYPIFVIFGLVVVGFIMMVFVVPKLTSVLAESGAELPWTTKLLIGTSSFMKGNIVSILIAVFLAAAGFRYWTSTGSGRQLWDKVKLFLPVFGPLLSRIYIVRFTRSMGTLVGGGVDIPSAIAICGDIVGNAHWKGILAETASQVRDGNSITTVLFKQNEKVVPVMIPQMLSVGEETGRLAEVTERLSAFYARELSNAVSNLVSAIEPLIMLVMGGAVGIMVAAIILPMYSLATNT